MLELDEDALPIHEEDDERGEPGGKTRIIICMSSTGSSRLLRCGAYLQSDTGFKRIVDFNEFELASMDRDANTSMTSCFCFLYFQTHLNQQASSSVGYTSPDKRLLHISVYSRSLSELFSRIRARSCAGGICMPLLSTTSLVISSTGLLTSTAVKLKVRGSSNTAFPLHFFES
jgi:hypothetical protein